MSDPQLDTSPDEMASGPWPVSGYADFRVSSQPDLRFVAVTDGRRCSVHALDDLIACGSIRWMIVQPHDEDDGFLGSIRWVYVSTEYRRSGIATALLDAARAYAEHYGIPTPRHSSERTAEGDAWARALGAEPAREIVTSMGNPGGDA